MLQWKLPKLTETPLKWKHLCKWECEGPKDLSVQTCGSAVSLSGRPALLVGSMSCGPPASDSSRARQPIPLTDPHFFTLTLDSRGTSPFKVKLPSNVAGGTCSLTIQGEELITPLSSLWRFLMEIYIGWCLTWPSLWNWTCWFWSPCPDSQATTVNKWQLQLSSL